MSSDARELQYYTQLKNRNIGIHGYPQVGMNMVPSQFVQPMPGGFQPMLPPGMTPQGALIRPPAYPMQPGFMPGMSMMPPAMMSPPPPAYTPQMAQNYRAKQRTPEQIREQEEQFRKERQYQEQRAKLQNFGRVGPAGRSGSNADKMIESMFGKTEKPRGKIHQQQVQQQQHAIAVSNTDTSDDGFGDFMSGPGSSQLVTQPGGANPAPALLSTQGQAPTNIPQPQGSISTQIPVTQNTTGQNGNSEIQVGSQQAEQKSEKDLMSMMMQCSDLRAPKQAKHFHQKRAVNDVAPHPHHVVPAHQQSQQARNWTAPAQNLDGLFQNPVPLQTPGKPPTPGDAVPTPPGGAAPPWCHARDTLPPLYRQVEEAVLVDGKVSTERLYPILLLSGLSREGLGHIWSLANQTTPGELQLHELYMVLAMIAIAQNNYTVPTLSMLAQCPAPPIPFLGMGKQAPPPTQQNPPSEQQAPPISQVDQSQTGSSSLSIKSAEVTQSDMEFTDFQQGPTPSSADTITPDDFGDFKVAEKPSNLAVTKSNIEQVKQSSAHSSPQRVLGVTDTLSPEDQHSNVTNFFCSDDSSRGRIPTSSVRNLSKKGPTTPNSLDDYFFDDTKSAASKASDSSQFSTHSEMSEGEDFKNFEIYVEQFGSKENLGSLGTGSPAKSVQPVNKPPIVRTTDKPRPALTSGNSHWGQGASSSAFPGPLAPPAVGSTSQPIEDEFSDFQDAGVPKVSSEINLMLDESSQDKYAALRGWTDTSDAVEPKSLLDSDSNPGLNTPADSVTFPAGDPTTTAPEDEDWADFKDCSEFTSSETFPPTEIVTEKSDSTQSKTDDYFPTVKSAHTNSPFPPMAVGDPPTSLFDTQKLEFPNDQNNGNSTDLFTQKPPMFGSSKPNQSPVFPQASPVDKDLHAVDFDLSRVPPPMDFHEEAEDEMRTVNFFDASPTLDPNSPTFETSFDQQHLSFHSTKHSSSNLSAGINNGEPVQKSSLHKSGSNASWGSNFNSLGPEMNSGAKQKEDSNSVSSLDFGYVSARPGVHKNPEPDGQSLGSADFVIADPIQNKGFNPEAKSLDSFDFQDESGTNGDVNRSTPESKSLDSLDLKKVDSREWSPDETEEGQGAGNSVNTDQEPTFTPVSAQAILQTGSLPTLGDRYSSVIQQVQGSDRHVMEWERCLESANQMLYDANSVFNSISSSAVCSEIIQCGPGTDYLNGVVEIYRVVRRISLAMESAGISSDKLNSTLKTINLGWNNFTAFIATSSIMPDPSSLDYRIAVLKSDDTASQLKACGVCLLNVDSRSKAFNEEKEGSKLTYGGRQYHTTCANFWVNCVDPMLPALRLPDLL